MKITHYAGYGSVEAKVIKSSTKGDLTTVDVQVWGNHEQGLGYYYDDKRSVVEWLAKKLRKLHNLTDERQIVTLTTHDDYLKDENGNYVPDKKYGMSRIDMRTYHIVYAPDKETAYNYL